MLKRMEFKTIALDTREGHLNTDRIYQLGYLLYETDTNMGKFSDGEHHFKDLPYFVGESTPIPPESSFKGLWNSETEYKEGDIVFDENGYYYLVVKQNIGEIPVESDSYIILNPDDETVYKGDYSEENTYNKGDYVIENEDFFVAVDNVESNIPLSDTNYWRQITDDHLVFMDFTKTNIDAKICLTTIDINDCHCDENCHCKCHRGIDNIKISKENSPTVNLKTGDMTITGTLYANGGIEGSAFNELLERVRILEEKIAELENH